MASRADFPADCSYFAADCPSRALFDQVTDKWSMMVLAVLDGGPMRFNAIKRQLEGITQKALTQCLRRLETNGMLTRTVLPLSPVAVEYELTELGRSLQKPLMALHYWILANLEDVQAARVRQELMAGA